jgi:ribosomal protein L24E
MREYIGSCHNCGKDIFCLDGFFTGVVKEDQKIFCFDCEKKEKDTKNPQG